MPVEHTDQLVCTRSFVETFLLQGIPAMPTGRRASDTMQSNFEVLPIQLLVLTGFDWLEALPKQDFHLSPANLYPVMKLA